MIRHVKDGPSNPARRYMMNLQAIASEIIAASAFGVIALVLFRLFRRARNLSLGWMPQWILGLLFGVGVAHIVMLFARPAWRADLRFFYDVALLTIAIMLWPCLAQVNQSLTHSVSRKLRRQLEKAQTEALNTRNWLLLAEEMAHIGHWRVSLPLREIFWSDEIYRIHGLTKGNSVLNYEFAINFLHPDDRERVAMTIETAIAKKSDYEFDARLVRPDGEIRHVTSRAVVQLNASGEVIAIFGVFLDHTVQKQTEQDLRETNRVAAHANRELHGMALEDALTGLANRRQFDIRLRDEVRRAARCNTPLGLIMIDLDHFKSYNDVYGHPAGDVCLRKVAQAIHLVPKRPGDLVARYGGEELAVLLPAADEQSACNIAEQIAEAIRALNLTHIGNAGGAVTISCGVAALAAGQGAGPLDLLHCADQALYRAKRGGRNRVTAHSETLWVSNLAPA